MTTSTEIESRVLSLVQTFLRELQAERALQAITLDASLDRDLGIDSLGKVELLHRIENSFSIHLPESAITEAETLRDLAKLIERTPTHSKTPPHLQQLSSIPNATIFDLSSAKTLVEILLAHATAEPNRPHIYLQDENGEEQIIRYGQLLEEAKKVARGLYKRGIQQGETIAIMLPTSAEFFYAFCGTLLAGAVPVPIYPPIRPNQLEEYIKREEKILQNAQVRILITFARAELLSNILKSYIPSIKEVTTLKSLQMEFGDLPNLNLETTDFALIQYTSGSTGDPKGVLLTHENFLANIRAFEQAIPVKPTEVTVSWLPLYHDMGLMNWLGSLYFGTPVTILSPLTFLSRPERWLWAIHYHRATLSGGPNFAYELCAKKINPKDIEGLDLSSWRFAFNGAEGINPKTLERFYNRFAPYGFKKEAFAPVYGLAESTVALTFPPNNRGPLIDKINRDIFQNEKKAIPQHDSDTHFLEFVACGKAMPNHAIRIVDDAGNEVPERVVGNLEFKGPSSMQGYLNNPAGTQKVYDNGWWMTGDLGYLVDKELFITGRKKDLIIKAGRNLYPEEIEEMVSLIPAIRKGCVIAFGVSDANTGTEKLVVVAEIYEQNNQKKQQIRAEIIEKMAVNLGIPPDEVVLVPPRTVPKTSSGKLQRSKGKQAYLNGQLTKIPMSAKLQFAKLGFISVVKKIMNGLSYAARLFYLLYLIIIIALTVTFLLLPVLLLPKRMSARIAKIWARNLFRLAGCPIILEGASHLQKESPVIFVSNHASYIDALLLIAILPSGIIFTAKKEVNSIPILRTLIKKLEYILVERTDFSKSIINKNQIESAILHGKSIVIFAEGTFTYATGLRPFKLGAFTIAAETKTPICPIAIQGTRQILRGDFFLPKPGIIKVTAEKALYPENKDWNDIMRLHAAVRSAIAKHCGEAAIDIITAGPVKE